MSLKLVCSSYLFQGQMVTPQKLIAQQMIVQRLVLIEHSVFPQQPVELVAQTVDLQTVQKALCP